MLAWIGDALPHTDYLLPNDEQVLGFTGATSLAEGARGAGRRGRRLRRRDPGRRRVRSSSRPTRRSRCRRTTSRWWTRPAAATRSRPASCAGSRWASTCARAAELGCATAAQVAQGLGTDAGEYSLDSVQEFAEHRPHVAPEPRDYARGMTDAPDIKPRSRDVTDGLEKAAARGMLRAVGMGDDDWVKPQIGVASSWNEITPCNLSLQRLAQAVKNGVHAAQGYPLEFGTISVSDGISMGHEGMHFSLVSREVIADSVETVMMAERLDGSVLLAGCDKSLPGMLMAAARLDLASVFLYAGSIMPGQVDGQDVTIIDAFEAVGACLAGKITRERVDEIERAICPGEGACGGMYTANTMAAVAEALGMSLPGSAAPPAVDRRRDGFAHRSGEAVVEMLRQGITARQILTHGGLRERDRRRDGARRLHQRRAPPARDRPRGRGRPDHRRLQPHRRQGAAPRRPQAVRSLRDERRRQDRRHPRRDEGAARRRPDARRLPDGDRQDDAREPRGARSGRHRRRGDPSARQADPQDRRPDDPQGLAGSRGRGREVGRLRRLHLHRHRPGLRRRARGDGRSRADGRSPPATSW